MKTKRQKILDTASDLMADFLYYDRKEDDELPVGSIEEAIDGGVVTKEELLNVFSEVLSGK